MNTRTSTIVLAVLLLLSTLGATGLWFGHGYIVSMKDRERELMKDIAIETERATRLQSLKGTFDRASEEKVKLEEYFFDISEEDWLRFAEEMGVLARASGATTDTSSDPPSPGATSLSATVKFSGTWDEVYRLLRLLETYPARVVLKEFSAQAEGSSRDAKRSVMWTGTLRVELLSVRPNK